MKNPLLILLFSFLFCAENNLALGQTNDVYAQQRSTWLQKAEAAKPPLIKQNKKPVCVVKAVKDTSAYQGWKTEKTGEIESFSAPRSNRTTFG